MTAPSPFSVLRNHTLTVHRKGAGAYVDGEFVPAGDALTFSIKCSVQNPTGEETETLPEGRRTDDARILFTDTQLYSVNGNSNPDQVELDGTFYEVWDVRPWQNNLINHYRYIIQKIEAK